MLTNRRQLLVAFLTGLTTLGLLILGTTSYLNAVDYAATARGVDVYLVTKTNQTTIGVPFAVDIFITNDSTPLNAMQAEVYFDNNLFSVDALTFGTALCEERFVIDRIIDNELGRVHMSCGTISPFTGNAAIFGTLTVTPRAEGLSELQFGTSTEVYIHDGLGTEIVRDTYPTTILVTTEV